MACTGLLVALSLPVRADIFVQGGNLNFYLNDGGTYVGYPASGELLISNSSTPPTGYTAFESGSIYSTSDNAFLGYGNGVAGTVTVTGSGAEWSVAGDTYLGYEGTSTGNLVISNGGAYSSPNGFIETSFSSGSTSSISVDGSGSTMNVGSIVLGNAGNASMSITNGGHVTIGENFLGVAFGEGTQTGSLTVSGAGSTLTFTVPVGNTNAYGVNMGGTNSSVQVINGGVINSNSDVLYSTPGSQTTALISGTGSLWSETGAVNVMSVGSTGYSTLIVADGGELQSNFVELANSGGAGNTGILQVGNGAAPGILDINSVVGGFEGSGTAIVEFDHNSTDYQFANPAGTGIAIEGTTQVQVVSGTTVFTSTGNTYTGGTQITGGTLVVDSGTGSGNVTVGAGGTLAGTGTIAPSGTHAVSISGNLSPGNTASGGTPGTLKFDLSAGTKLTFNAGSTLTLNLVGGGTSDEVSFTSTAAAGTEWLAGAGNLTLVLNLSGTDPYGQTYDIFNNAIGNSTTGQFTLAGITGYNSSQYQAVFSQSGDNYDLSFIPVSAPEPSTWLLLSLGSLMLVWRLRTRRDSGK
jgi:T5SS/PEP-CTERM-associated repeat protein/autotransporter-associated beta strand protein